MGWAVRGLGLLGVSVVSGLLWLAITGTGEQDQADQQPEQSRTVHDFDRVLRIDGQQKCSDVSKEDIKEFFDEQGCNHLTRALYTTTLDDGQRVLTSVVGVRMANSGAATQLNKLLTGEDTGNIKDLVEDREAFHLPNEFPSLEQDYGYWSQVEGKLVIVGDSAYFSNPDHEDDRLTAVTRDALKKGKQQDSN